MVKSLHLIIKIMISGIITVPNSEGSPVSDGQKQRCVLEFSKYVVQSKPRVIGANKVLLFGCGTAAIKNSGVQCVDKQGGNPYGYRSQAIAWVNSLPVEPVLR